MIKSAQDALDALDAAWPTICSECRLVLGSELHYQAMVYHALRKSGVPLEQIGMNVKQWIPKIQSETFQRLALRKHEKYQEGYEPIPDIVIFSAAVGGDWRRRNFEITLSSMLVAIEIKASERAGKRLSRAEVLTDIRKLSAQQQEVQHRGANFHPIMMIIDTAPIAAERMAPQTIEEARAAARMHRVEWRYFDPTHAQVDRL